MTSVIIFGCVSDTVLQRVRWNPQVTTPTTYGLGIPGSLESIVSFGDPTIRGADIMLDVSFIWIYMDLWGSGKNIYLYMYA